MREIKFRAWDKKEKAMASVMAMTFDSPDYNPRVDLNYRLYLGFDDTQAITESVELSEVELMQYTGLKDCKGVEIYEGDILASRYTCDDSFEHNQLIVVDMDDFSNLDYIKTRDGVEFKVIGNIYENKELLK